jgi:hypothetical protein
MKLYEIFDNDEQYKLDTTGLFDTVITNIVADCMPYLSEIQKDPVTYKLFRGMSVPKLTDERKPYVVPVRKNRRPLHTNIHIHNTVDDYFYKQFGTPFRSSSIFCFGGTGGPANGYSEPTNSHEIKGVCLIFPIGKINWLYSPHVQDMFIDIPHDATPNFAHKWVKSQQYQGRTKKVSKGNLTEAIRSGNEIMVECDNFYAIPLNITRTIQGKLTFGNTSFHRSNLLDQFLITLKGKL